MVQAIVTSVNNFYDLGIQDYLIDHSLMCPNCKKKGKPDELISNISLRKSIIDFENSRVRTITTETSQANRPKVSENQAAIPMVTPLGKSLPLTTIPISNVTNFASTALQQMALASSSLINSLIPKINLPPKFPLNLKPDLKMIKVAAPFLTTQYAKSVINGERVLTKEEFSSLKTTLNLE